MADLYHLLDELEEDDPDHDDAIKVGRVSMATEATEPLSEDWDSPGRVEVPAALQEAKKHMYDDDDEQHLFGGTGMEEDVLGTHHVENELYSKLHHHWLQERHGPELLEYDDAMVDDLKQLLEERQEWIDQTLEGSSESVDALMMAMAQLDLDRVKFVLSDWLTCRLSKIEAHPLYMREQVDHLSDAELAYLKQYGTLLEHHLRQTVLDHIPEAWQSLDEANMIDQPDYDGYHFWLVKETIDNGETEQEAGTCLVAKYKDMRENMRENKVELQL
jgi:hypothetical protein